jgi:hypothetical protein
VIAVGRVGGVDLQGLGANAVIYYREEAVRKGAWIFLTNLLGGV